MTRLALATALSLVACSGSRSGGIPHAKVSVATEQVGDLSVELFTDAELRTGLTPIWLEVTQGGHPVADATVAFVPRMTMSDGTSHGAPVLAPPALDADGSYRCDVVFQMPTGSTGSWGATVTVTRPSAAPVDVPFVFSVAESGRAKTFVGTDPATQVATKYVASLNLDGAAVVGLNPVTVTLHWMESATSFPPVNDATLHLATQMTSMGHGGGDCVDPVPVVDGPYAGVGVYAGEEAFSMPGGWETTLTVTRGGAQIGAPQFALEF